MYDWVVIGGGIHGVMIAHWLISYEFADPSKLCILDPSEAPLNCWRKRTSAVGMSHLRSPSVHHLGLEPFELHQLSRKDPYVISHPFAPPYSRPSLELFEKHLNEVLDISKIKMMWKQGIAKNVVKDSDTYIISTNEEEIRSKKVILAIGASTKLAYPDWVKDDFIETEKVQHIFQENFDRELFKPNEKVLVVGGGISAVQLATALSENLRNKVVLYSRHELRKFEFDSDPCWVGPKCMKKFNRVTSYSRRRKLINTARHKGSVSSEAMFNFKRAKNDGGVSHRVRDIKRVELTPSGQLDTISQGNKSTETFDRIILATGFDIKRPGGELVDDLIEKENLEVAECGFPITKEDMSWCEGLYVMGALAELRIGPVARNIIGGRKAAERILQGLKN